VENRGKKEEAKSVESVEGKEVGREGSSERGNVRAVSSLTSQVEAALSKIEI
jgi:hypothetical protein